MNVEQQIELSAEWPSASRAILSVKGELDIATGPGLRHALVEMIEQVPSVIVLNLIGVEFIDSSALGVILNVWKLMEAQGGQLLVVCGPGRVARLLEITGLSLSLAMYDTVEEAWRSVAASDVDAPSHPEPV